MDFLVTVPLHVFMYIVDMLFTGLILQMTLKATFVFQVPMELSQ